MRRVGRVVVCSRVWSVVAALVVVSLLGGCFGGESGPAESPSAAAVEPSATPTRSPEPSPPPRPERPQRPAAMDEPTKAGAEAAVRYFLELYDYAFATGKLDEFERLSDDACEYCNAIVDEVRQAVEDGLLTERDPSVVTDVSVVEIRPSEWFTVEFRLQQGEIRLLGDDGSVLAVDGAGSLFDFGVALSWVEGAWTVDEVSVRGVE